jgi:hypothetical protein
MPRYRCGSSQKRSILNTHLPPILGNSQPFQLIWPEGTRQHRHVPDYFARVPMAPPW